MTQLNNSATITWKIENFANLDSYQYSSDFETNQEKFMLACIPNLELDISFENVVYNYGSIYLIRNLPHTADLKVLWTISLISDKGEECCHEAIEENFTVEGGQSPIDGNVYHLDRDTILDRSSGLLPDGKLIVKCNVTVLDGQNNKITLAHKKARKNYDSFLESSKLSDVVFVIGEKEFKLHKAILASQSPVFSVMFENDLEEAKQNRVEIADIDVEVFEAMIRFIYTGNVDSVQQYALDLFVSANKYQLDSLKDICADHLGSNLTIENVANILLVADMHSEAELKSKCIEFINNKNATKVFATDGWKQLLKSRHELVDELYYNLTNKFEST